MKKAVISIFRSRDKVQLLELDREIGRRVIAHVGTYNKTGDTEHNK